MFIPVAQRTREFGIRMALGAEPHDVGKLVLLTAGRVLAAGLVGLALSLLASRMLADRMQGMGTADPLLFVVVSAVLTIATIAACFLPARSAVPVQPMEALRHE